MHHGGDAQRPAAFSWQRLCVLLPLFLRAPRARSQASCSDHHQLSLILETLGTPSIDDFYAINSQRSREYIRALPFRRKKSFAQMFPAANPLVRRLCRLCARPELY